MICLVIFLISAEVQTEQAAVEHCVEGTMQCWLPLSPTTQRNRIETCVSDGVCACATWQVKYS